MGVGCGKWMIGKWNLSVELPFVTYTLSAGMPYFMVLRPCIASNRTFCDKPLCFSVLKCSWCNQWLASKCDYLIFNITTQISFYHDALFVFQVNLLVSKNSVINLQRHNIRLELWKIAFLFIRIENFTVLILKQSLVWYPSFLV